MKVSAVITTYNRKIELAELLESLHRQTHKLHEIVIVNDAGITIEDVAELYKNLPLVVMNLKENAGHVQARNIGIQRATGDYIMLCDDDDLILPNHIASMSVCLQSYDFVYSDAEIVDFKLIRGTRFPQSRRLFAYSYDKNAMKRFSTYIPSGSVYRKNIHEAIGLFDPNVHNYWDWDFILRVSEKFHVKRMAVASVLYAFSENGNNQSFTISENRKHYLKALCQKHQLGELPSKNFFLLLEEPELKEREAESKVYWDGMPIISRLAALEDPLTI